MEDAISAHTASRTIDSFIDPATMKLVAQRWFGAEEGIVRFAETTARPSLPDTNPPCPESGQG